ncbi:TPA: TIGR00266 family protein [bacterium]|nr:TIGR00266 family protein [bacterium]
MEVEVRYCPSYSLAIVKLKSGESITAEAGAMVSTSSGVTIETEAAGGLLTSLKRKFLGGESLFMNTYTAPAKGGEVTLAPPLPGDMKVCSLKQESLMVQSGSYVASSRGVNLDTKWAGAKAFFAREGLFMLKASGTGIVIISSYGAIHEVELEPDEHYIVDTGHLVAFTEGVSFKIKRVGGLKSTLFSGEGLVVDLSGSGRVILQTRSDDAFLSWLIPRLPKERSGS